MPRLDYTKIAPEGYQKLVDVLGYIKASGLEEPLIHQVYLHVSQINGCPYCIDLHFRDAIEAGVDARKLNSLSVFRDVAFFTERERAALEWAETVTIMGHQYEISPIYDRVKEQFNEKELVDLTFAISLMNTFNRIGIAFNAVPKV